MTSKHSSFSSTFLSHDRQMYLGSELQMYLGSDPLEVKHCCKLATGFAVSAARYNTYKGLYCSKYHWTSIVSIPWMKVRFRLIIGDDSLSNSFSFCCFFHVRHEIENLREKSSIQMAFSKRQKTVRICSFHSYLNLNNPRTLARWNLRWIPWRSVQCSIRLSSNILGLLLSMTSRT